MTTTGKVMMVLLGMAAVFACESAYWAATHPEALVSAALAEVIGFYIGTFNERGHV